MKNFEKGIQDEISARQNNILNSFSNVEKLVKGGSRGTVGEIRTRPNGKKYLKTEKQIVEGKINAKDVSIGQNGSLTVIKKEE